MANATSTAQIVDFSNVKDGGNFNRKRIPAGDYLARIVKIEDAKAKDDIFQYLVSIKIEKHSSSVFPYYCKLQENQLWKLRNLLIAAGLNVPKKRQRVDPARLLNKLIGVTIEDTEYDGKEQSEIAGIFPTAELTDAPDVDDDDEDEEAEEEAEESLDDLDSTDESEEEEEEPEEEPEEEEQGDEWDSITDRLELRKALKKVAPDVKTSTKQTDDDIRDLIREHSASTPAVAKPAAKPAAAVRKVAAKKPAATVTDDELDELDIDDL